MDPQGADKVGRRRTFVDGVEDDCVCVDCLLLNVSDEPAPEHASSFRRGWGML